MSLSGAATVSNADLLAVAGSAMSYSAGAHWKPVVSRLALHCLGIALAAVDARAAGALKLRAEAAPRSGLDARRSPGNLDCRGTIRMNAKRTYVTM
jgi:hypothetical protein